MAPVRKPKEQTKGVILRRRREDDYGTVDKLVSERRATKEWRGALKRRRDRDEDQRQ